MKKLLAILVCITMVGICSSATAATVLSDKELGELYAGIPVMLNIPVFNNPVTEQTNIATVTAIGYGYDGDIFGTGISQKNKARVTGSIMGQLSAYAVGKQTNMAALYASDGDIIGTTISQRNKAKLSGAVISTGWWFWPGSATGIQAQFNVATLVAMKRGCGDDGDIAFTSIRQKNKAKICGMVIGDTNATGIASQTNMAALYAGDDISCTSISQKNKAKVRGSVIAPCTVTSIGPQKNIATLVAKGDIMGSCIRQSNKASVSPGFQMFGLY